MDIDEDIQSAEDFELLKTRRKVTGNVKGFIIKVGATSLLH